MSNLASDTGWRELAQKRVVDARIRPIYGSLHALLPLRCSFVIRVARCLRTVSVGLHITAKTSRDDGRRARPWSTRQMAQEVCHVTDIIHLDPSGPPFDCQSRA